MGYALYHVGIVADFMDFCLKIYFQKGPGGVTVCVLISNMCETNKIGEKLVLALYMNQSGHQRFGSSLIMLKFWLVNAAQRLEICIISVSIHN